MNEGVNQDYTWHEPLAYTTGYWPPSRLCATDDHSLGAHSWCLGAGWAILHSTNPLPQGSIYLQWHVGQPSTPARPPHSSPGQL